MDSARKRLLYYLLLNILVSACTTATVLFVYDRYYRPSTVPASLMTSQGGQGSASPEISTIIGAGIPSSELVLLRNTGQAPAELAGWKLQDQDGNVYTFPEVAIQPGGAIQLHSAPGTNSLIDLYWGLSASVWTSGETVTLLDPAGTVRSVYQVP
jgi:hypothetical protein